MEPYTYSPAIPGKQGGGVELYTALLYQVPIQVGAVEPYTALLYQVNSGVEWSPSQVPIQGGWSGALCSPALTRYLYRAVEWSPIQP